MNTTSLSPTASPAQRDVYKILHGSEEGSRSPASRASTNQVQQPEEEDEEVVLQAQHRAPTKELAAFSVEDVAALFKEAQASSTACQEVLNKGIDGPTFAEILKSSEALAVLKDDLLVDSALVRIRLLKTPRSDSQSDCERAVTNKLRVSRAPDFPHSGGNLPEIAEFKTYGISVAGWLALVSERMGKLCTAVFKDSRVDLSEVAHLMTPTEQMVDTIWANEIMRRGNIKTMKHLQGEAKFNLDDHRSGLQIVCTLGSVIAGKSTKKVQKLLETFNAREPVRHEARLLDELNGWDIDVEALDCTTSALTEQSKYNSIKTMISKIEGKRTLNVELGIPVALCELQTPGDYINMRVIVDNVAEEYYAPEKPSGQFQHQHQQGAYGAEEQSICFKHREGTCPFGKKCRRLHTASKELCTDQKFTSTGRCSKWGTCIDMHPRPDRAERVASCWGPTDIDDECETPGAHVAQLVTTTNSEIGPAAASIVA